MTHETVHLPVRRITPDDAHYFFAYFDKCPWDPEGKHVLAHRAVFNARQPAPNDVAQIGVVEPGVTTRFRRLGETRAWCWQLGSQAQWMHGENRGRFIYNDRRDGRFVSVAADLSGREHRTWPAPVYALSPDGAWAATCNFSRLAVLRPGYGYEGVPDPWSSEPHPADDGIYRIDLPTGNVRLLVSLDRLAQQTPRPDTFDFGRHWVNHLVVSPDSRRLMFLHRWQVPHPPGRWETRMFTIGADGEDLYLLNDNKMTSHMTWFADDRIIAFAGREHWGYYEFRDRTQDVRELGADRFDGDGHCSYSPDGKWMLTDTYPHPDTHERTLILFRLRDGTRFDIGRFRHDPKITGPFRCDLHPRFDRTGQQICFDSIHEGFRGVYVVDATNFLRQQA